MMDMYNFTRVFRVLAEWKTRKSRLRAEEERKLQPFSVQTVHSEPNGRPSPSPRVCLLPLPRVNYLPLTSPLIRCVSCSVSMETALGEPFWVRELLSV